MEEKKTLSEARVSNDLSQIALAKLVGVAPSTIVQAEMGRPIFRSTFQRLCKQLGVGPNDLTGVVVVRRIGKRTRKGVTVGSGTPIHRKPAVPVIVKPDTIGSKPGIYHIRIVSDSWSKDLPPIIRKDGWVTTDILNYVVENGYDVLLDEAWVFEE